MRVKFSLISSLVILFTLLYSCSKDDEGYSLGDIWISLGMVETTGTPYGYIIHCDNGDTLVPMASNAYHFHAEDSLRVLVNYTILDEVDNSEKKFWVKIHDLREVLYKTPIQVNTENNDSIGNDPVVIDDLWISKNLLNIEFSYRGNLKTHYINLTYNNINADEPLQLEFRHNTNNDDDTYSFRGLVTFDLSVLKRSGQDSLQYTISSTDYDGQLNTYDGVYRY